MFFQSIFNPCCSLIFSKSKSIISCKQRSTTCINNFVFSNVNVIIWMPTIMQVVIQTSSIIHWWRGFFSLLSNPLQKPPFRHLLKIFDRIFSFQSLHESLSNIFMTCYQVFHSIPNLGNNYDLKIIEYMVNFHFSSITIKIFSNVATTKCTTSLQLIAKP